MSKETPGVYSSKWEIPTSAETFVFNAGHTSSISDEIPDLITLGDYVSVMSSSSESQLMSMIPVERLLAKARTNLSDAVTIMYLVRSELGSFGVEVILGSAQIYKQEGELVQYHRSLYLCRQILEFSKHQVEAATKLVTAISHHYRAAGRTLQDKKSADDEKLIPRLKIEISRIQEHQTILAAQWEKIRDILS